MGKYGDIAETLFHYYQVLMRHYPEDSIMGVFLYGSQNYNFDTPTSDIDAKAIYIPTYEEMVNLKEPVSRVYGTDYGNVEVKDIRLMWKMWKKQNINFIEVLFTDYYLTNKNYTDLWEFLRTSGPSIARYNPLYTVNSIAGQCRGTLSYTVLTGKKIANFARLITFLDKYLNNEPYRKCITVDEEFRNKWLSIKQNDKPFYKKDAADQIEELAEKLNCLQIKGEELYKDKEINNDPINELVTNIMLDAIKIRKKLEN